MIMKRLQLSFFYSCILLNISGGVKIAATSVVSAPQLITSGPQLRKLIKEFGTKTQKKTNEEKELVELSDTAVSDNGEHNKSSISVITGNTNIAANSGSSPATISHDHLITSKNLSAIATDQSKLHLSQKIDQDIHKRIRQKGTKTSLESSNTDMITDFTTIELENTTMAVSSSKKFLASDDSSNRNTKKILNTVTDQQLSNRYASFAQSI